MLLRFFERILAGILSSAITLALLLLLFDFVAPIEFQSALARISSDFRDNIVSQPITDRIIASCGEEYDTNYNRLRCINQVFRSLYVYKHSKNYCPPDDTLLFGGDCKCSSAWYNYVLSRLNITHWFSTSKEHVNIEAEFVENGLRYTCWIDQGYMGCSISKAK